LRGGEEKGRVILGTHPSPALYPEGYASHQGVREYGYPEAELRGIY